MKQNRSLLKLCICIFFYFSFTFSAISEPCDTTGISETRLLNGIFSNISYTYFQNGTSISLNHIDGLGYPHQQFLEDYLNPIIKDIIKNSLDILDSNVTEEQALAGFPIIIQIPSCWDNSIMLDHFFWQPCPGDCCSRIFTLRKVGDEIVIDHISQALINEPTECGPESIECEFACDVFTQLEYELTHGIPCFIEMCDSEPYTTDFSQDGQQITYTTDTNGTVSLNPIFKIQECDDWYNIALESVHKMSGDWSQMTNDEIITFLIKYALKHLTGDRQSVNVKFSLPCLTRVDSSLILCIPTECCYMNYIVTREGNKVYAEEVPISPGLSRTCYPNIPEFTSEDELLALEDCNLDCYWKITGNPIIDEFSFIGPTDGHDFIIKTKQDAGEIMNRIRVDNNSRIDFNLNRWFSMPQISFDADPALHDPTIKLYRPTGMNTQNGVYEAFPWWITVSGTSGTSPNTSVGTFDIWSGSEALVGSESMSKVFTILRNGNVGIGVEVPKSKLELSGDLRLHGILYTTEIVVSEPANWPDFVFGKDYKLISLSEVSDFIKKNGRLPDVPSAETIKNDGLKVVEMQALLLKKIEELTLHLIEMKKENEQIKQELNTIKKTINK